MPNVPVSLAQGNAFDSAEYVLTHIRAILNDVMEDVDGEIFTNDWAPTWTYLNQGYRLCQHELSNNGVETNVKEVVMTNITPCANADPTTQVWISYSGYFDGATNHANPRLPADMIIPLRLWERFAGTFNPFIQITPAQDGLPGAQLQLQQFRYHDWRANAIYFPGATMNNEIRLRYNAYFPELTGPTSVVGFPRMAMALAYMTAWCFVNPRGGANAPSLLAMAQNELDQIVSQTTRKKQRRGVQKRAYGSARGGFGGLNSGV